MFLIETTRQIINTRGEADVIDISGAVEGFVQRTGLRHGVVVVFVPGSTASVTTLEFEPGLIEDLQGALDRIAPRTQAYKHDLAWGDGNGYSHVRAALLGPSVVIPVVGGKMATGRWQQVVLIDFDNRPRTREIMLQVQGERTDPEDSGSQGR